jgi:hypothetical protein
MRIRLETSTFLRVRLSNDPNRSMVSEVRAGLGIPTRWIVLAISIAAYAIAVRQIKYGMGSGLLVIDEGVGWYLFAIAGSAMARVTEPLHDGRLTPV